MIKRNQSNYSVTDAHCLVLVNDEKDMDILRESFPILEKQRDSLPTYQETIGWDEKKIDAVMNEYCYLDNLIEILSEEIDSQSEQLCQMLWTSNPKQKCYCLSLSLEYQWSYDSYGEADIDIHIQCLEVNEGTTFEDLYSIHTTLYPIDYQVTGESVLVKEIVEIINHSTMDDGIYYITKKNQSEEELLINVVDNTWFSSIELATNAYQNEIDMAKSFDRSFTEVFGSESIYFTEI